MWALSTTQRLARVRVCVCERERERERAHSKYTTPMAESFLFVFSRWAVARRGRRGNSPTTRRVCLSCSRSLQSDVPALRGDRGGRTVRPPALLLLTFPQDWHRMGTWTVWIQRPTNCWHLISGKPAKPFFVSCFCMSLLICWMFSVTSLQRCLPSVQTPANWIKLLTAAKIIPWCVKFRYWIDQ